METKQPIWKRVGTIGDVNFTKYSGGLVFIDESGVYPPELEYVHAGDTEEQDAYVYRVVLENLKLSPEGKLIPARYDASWPEPIENYAEWFDRDLDKVGEFVGIPRRDLVAYLVSSDPMLRALAYESMASFHGWANFDSYPLRLNPNELLKRYRNHPYERKA